MFYVVFVFCVKLRYVCFYGVFVSCSCFVVRFLVYLGVISVMFVFLLDDVCIIFEIKLFNLDVLWRYD